MVTSNSSGHCSNSTYAAFFQTAYWILSHSVLKLIEIIWVCQFSSLISYAYISRFYIGNPRRYFTKTISQRRQRGRRLSVRNKNPQETKVKTSSFRCLLFGFNRFIRIMHQSRKWWSLHSFNPKGSRDAKIFTMLTYSNSGCWCPRHNVIASCLTGRSWWI